MDYLVEVAVKVTNIQTNKSYTLKHLGHASRLDPRENVLNALWEQILNSRVTKEIREVERG